MSKDTTSWQSLDLKIKTLVVLSLIQGPILVIIGFIQSIDHSAEISAAEESVAPAVSIISQSPESKSTRPNKYQNFPDLSCPIQDVKGKDSFTCGGFQINITTFDEYGSDMFLGGHIPENKSPESIGCQIRLDKIICREEKKIDQGRADGVIAYRAFTASYEIKPRIKKTSERIWRKIYTNRADRTPEFKAFVSCSGFEESFARLDETSEIADVLKCNVGNEPRMKKCLMENPMYPNSSYVTLEAAAGCWFDVHYPE